MNTITARDDCELALYRNRQQLNKYSEDESIHDDVCTGGDNSRIHTRMIIPFQIMMYWKRQLLNPYKKSQFQIIDVL